MSLARWWPPFAWAALVLTATSIPNLSLPGPSGTDKAGHFFMYCMLGFLLQRAAAPLRSARTLLVVLAAITTFAGVDEWHQQAIPGRSADVADFVADVAGATTGAVLAFFVARRPAVVA